jgi:hypothetical protein
MTNKKLELLKEYTDVQANDYGVWIIPKNSKDAYILQEFRRLIWMIEEANEQQIENEIDMKKTELGICSKH